MRTAKQYVSCRKQTFRTEFKTCPRCGSRLRRYTILSHRTIITLDGPLTLTHYGFRCPHQACSTHPCSYRSAAADALALPGFTFGLDVIIWIGQVRLAQHQTLDETHQAVQAKLTPHKVTISRREVLYLFDAYCTLLRIAQQPEHDPTWAAWLAQVEANGGLLLALDGIQPDKGNETVYLVREVLTGRLLAAENVRSSSTSVIKQLLAPVVALGLPVHGVISDAQESLLLAVADLWPGVPHQVCQFHYLRDASQAIYEADRAMRTTLRKQLQPKVRAFRDQVDHRLATRPDLDAAEVAQLHVLDDYALSIQTALHLDGRAPFTYAGLQTYDALADIDQSVRTLEKKGQPPVGSA